MATTPTSLFEDLKTELEKFNTFLGGAVGDIRPAMPVLRSLIPAITDLLTKLIDLMKSIKAEVDRLATPNIPAVAEVSQFTTGVTSLLNAAKNLLPDQAGTIDDVLRVANLVSSLPSVGDIKGQIDLLIDQIVGHLETLKNS